METKIEKSVISSQNDYIKSWDGLRGFFTIFVVLSHLNILRNAWVSIGFFFALSGLMITSMTFNIIEKKGELNLLMFYHRRIARIIPGAFLVIVVICLYVAFATTFYPNQISLINLYWLRIDMLWATFYASNWQLIIKGEDYFAQYESLTLLRHYWSLAIEEQYYIVWPILLLLWMFVVPKFLSVFFDNKASSLSFRNLVISVLVGDLIVLIISSVYQYNMMQAETPQYVIYYSTIIHLKEFALGGAGAAIVRLIPSLQGLMHSQQPYIPKYSFHQRMLLEIFICLLISYPIYLATLADWETDEDVFIWYFNYGICPTIVVVVLDIFLAIQAKEMLEEECYYFPMSRLFLSSDLIVYLGRISYQTYLWHVPIIVWTNAACKEGMTTEYVTKAIMVIAFIYFFSAMISRFYEFPMQRYILSFNDTKKVIACLFITMLTLSGIICYVTRNYEDPYAYVEKEKFLKEFNDDFKDIVPKSIPSTLLNTPTPVLLSNGSSSIYDQNMTNINKSKKISSHHKNSKNSFLLDKLEIMDRMRSNGKIAHTYDKKGNITFQYQTVFLQNTANSFGISELQSLLRRVNHHGKVIRKEDLSDIINRKEEVLFVIFSNDLNDCITLEKQMKLIEAILYSSYFLYIHHNNSKCSFLTEYYTLVNKKKVIEFNLNMMEPGQKYLNEINHPLYASTYLEKIPEKLPIQNIKLLSGIIIDYAVTSNPEIIKFFKVVAFEGFKYIYHDILKSKNLHSRKTKYHIAYLGNSIAERYAYFTEHMRLQIISSCFDEYEMLSNTTTTSLPLNQLQQHMIGFYDMLTRVSIRNAAHANYRVIDTLPKDIDELLLKKKYLMDNHVTTVIVEDSDFIAGFLREFYLNESINNRYKMFYRLLLFLDVLHKMKIERVYLHDINHLNWFSKNVFKDFDIHDKHLGYKAIISALDQCFELCELYNNKDMDGNEECLGNEKLHVLKNMLHIVDASYLTCPKRSILRNKEIHCSPNVWGYTPILSDGEHPSGKAGEFLATNVLYQILQDFYINNVIQQQPQLEQPQYHVNSVLDLVNTSSYSLIKKGIKRRIVDNSTLSLYTTEQSLLLCGLKDIKIV